MKLLASLLYLVSAVSAVKLTLLAELDDPDLVLGEYLIRFTNATTYEQHKEVNFYPSLSFSSDGRNVHIASGALTDDELAQVETWEGVLYINHEMLAHSFASGTQNNPVWGLDRIDDRSGGGDGTFSWSHDGSSTGVFVLDTGIYKGHSDFASGQTVFGGDCTRGSSCPTTSDSGDPQGHGTHVGGTVGSQTYGVAKNAYVIDIRVLNADGSGATSWVINGIAKAMSIASQNPSLRFVINMSLGFSGRINAIDDAVEDAWAAGIVVVVAAGNDYGANACNGSPSGAQTVITVASSTSSDRQSDFSSDGPCVDIFAPGSSIRSLSRTGGTTTISGTSMASPHVAGAVAAMLDRSPGLSPSQVESQLRSTATANALSGVPGDTDNLLLYSPPQ